MNISDTCNAAADLIEVRGWTDGSDGWGDDEPTGPLCAEGALLAASGGYGIVGYCPAYSAVIDYLQYRDGEGDHLYRWNDRLALGAPYSENPHPYMSDEANAWAREQVVATLRAVAVIHAAREDETATTDGVPIALAPVLSEVTC